MVCVRSIIVTLVLVSTLLAGCIGDDEEPDPEGPEESKPTEDTGSISGQIFDSDLQPIGKARITLITPEDVIARNVTSQENGNYVVNNVEPGTYRLRASAFCCEEKVETITVFANEELRKSFQLKTLSDDDLKIPYEVTDDHVGFIACQFTLPNNHSSGCAVVEGNAPRHAFGAGHGLRTIVASLSWEGGTGTASAQELEFQIRNTDGDVYERKSGVSPLEIRLDNSELTSAPFEEFDEDGLTLELSARPTPGSFVYQQKIRYDWYLHYWEEAPDGISVIPDQ